MKPGEVLHFKPTELKRNLYPEDMLVTYRADVLCPLTRLQQLLVDSWHQGQPITNYLSRPMTRDKSSFIETSLSVSAFEEEVAQHFHAAGVSYHVTLHGSRRGSLQEVYQVSQSMDAVGKRGQIKTPHIRELYVNAVKHRPSRLKKGPRPVNKTKGQQAEQLLKKANAAD
jgi:hypothetical protein